MLEYLEKNCEDSVTKNERYVKEVPLTCCLFEICFKFPIQKIRPTKINVSDEFRGTVAYFSNLDLK